MPAWQLFLGIILFGGCTVLYVDIVNLYFPSLSLQLLNGCVPNGVISTLSSSIMQSLWTRVLLVSCDVEKPACCMTTPVQALSMDANPVLSGNGALRTKLEPSSHILPHSLLWPGMFRVYSGRLSIVSQFSVGTPVESK
jgi:hypothetical protein